MRLLTTKMMVLGLVAGLLLALPMGPLQALGLGEARVDSFLGQPLDLRIRLVDADQRALDSLTVMPASVRDHERLGVPSDSLALGLDLSVDRRVDPPVLRVRTRRAVNEPVIQFLVDARWSGGRVLREYTLFLDPPTLDIAPPARVRRDSEEQADRPAETATETPPVARPEPAQPAAPAARPAEPPRDEPEVAETPAVEPSAVEQAASETPVSRPSTTSVAAGQTLWSIAYAWRPDTNLTMNQVMLAIRDRNPQAFVDGNVNRLLRGAVLEMPELGEVQALDAREADRRMAAQMQAWQRSPQGTEVPVVTEAAVPEVLTERSTEAPAEPPVETVHRLEVVPPEGEMADDGSAATEAEMTRASARLDGLEDQLLADPDADRSFWSDIGRIREAIESREAAGLAVADEEMALLETRLRESRLAREAAAAEADVAETAVDGNEVAAYFRDLESELVTDADSQEATAPETRLESGDESAAGDALPESDEVAVAEPSPAAPATERSGGVPVWVWLVLAFIILLVLILVVMLKRRSSRDEGSAAAGTATDVPRLREQVAADPANLTAHLALLHALGERDGAVGFDDALDDMYTNVADEEADEWQAALILAAEYAPHHPLLMPPEEEIREGDPDDGLDDQTRDMLGLLDQDNAASDDRDDGDNGDEEGSDDVSGDDDPDEELLDPVDHEDTDLAVLADRLDPEPSADGDSLDDASSDDDDPVFTLDDEQQPEPDDIAATPDSREANDQAAETSDDLDLDFSFSSQVETVPGEGEEDEVVSFEDDMISADDDQRSELAADGEAAPSDAGAAEDELEAFLRAEESDETLEDIADPEVDAEPLADADDSADDPVDEVLGDGDGSLNDDDAEVKLDLARAYLAMEDPESARTLLEEIDAGGSASMRAEARKLLKDL